MQKYVILPAVDSVTFADAPAAINPVANDLFSAVASWVTVSLFVIVTVLPTATVIGFGLYAVLVSVEAPRTMEIVMFDEAPPPPLLPPDEDPFAGGSGVVEPPPHAARPMTVRDVSASRVKLRMPPE